MAVAEAVANTPTEPVEVDAQIAEVLAHDDTNVKVVVVGHVDHGKSTLIGRIFFDTDALPEGKADSIRRAAEAEGMPFEYAFLLDALLEEQAQNITIDTTRLVFRTPKRPYILIDAPGHREFLKNMVTGAAQADAAILLVSAPDGMREQSRRHGYLLRLLGVHQVVVAINKMDLVDYDQARFREVQADCEAFLHQISLTAQQFVPVSAREGDNIARRAMDKMPWYDGPSILETLDNFTPPVALTNLPLRLPVQGVYRFDARRLVSGRIEAGMLRVGDEVVFAPGDKRAKVATFERWHGPARDYAVAGESVAFTLDDELFVERGQIAGVVGLDAPQSARLLRANLFWMARDPLGVGQAVTVKLGTAQTTGRIRFIEQTLDAATLEARPEASEVRSGEVAEVVLETDTPLAFDSHDRISTTGRFVLVHERKAAGGGIIFGAASPAPVSTAPKSDRAIVWSDTQVSPDEKGQKNRHRGAVVWLTGLSGSGKSTIAGLVHRQAFEAGWQATMLDGDNLRHGLCSDLGFSLADRAENIRRAGHVARLLAESGLVTLCSFISPSNHDRQIARQIAAEGNIAFIEVFVDAPLETVEGRDVKGLYKRARAGEIKEFTGVSAPYEAPAAPDLTLSTANESREESAERLWQELQARLSL